MLKRRIFLLIVCFAVLSVSAVPSMGLIQFSAQSLGMDFTNGNIFSAYNINESFMILTREVVPVGNVVFDGTIATSQFFLLEMTLENITLYTATATGELAFTDLDGDTIDGDITGSWALVGGYPYFYGTLSDVQVTTDDDEFNGTDGSFIPLDFTDPPPWIGAVVVLTTVSAPWFSNEWTETETGGGITGWFVPVTLKADINSDNKVNLVDFAILAGQWRQAPGQQSADIYPSGGDGIVNLLDLGVLCDYWLEGTEP